MSKIWRLGWVCHLRTSYHSKCLIFTLIAQVESLLNSEVTSNLPSNNAPIPAQPDATSINPQHFWEGVSMDMGLGAEADNLNSSIPNMSLPLLPDESFSYDLIGYGLEEQLPAQHLIDDL